MPVYIGIFHIILNVSKGGKMDILLVDDEELSRIAIKDFITEQLGHNVFDYTNGVEAFKAWEERHFSVVISDIKMPLMDGHQLLESIKKDEAGKKTDVILMTGFADVDSTVRALRNGAYDYLQKPVEIEELAALLDRIEEHQTLLVENQQLKNEFNKSLEKATDDMQKKLNYFQAAYSNISGIGNVGIFSEIMQSIMSVAEKLHHDRSIPVLIEGATGTGKEIVARKVHFGNNNSTRPFVTINCAAISPTLFESELFGYEEGAFTGAKRHGNIGKMEMAQGGTLFLDEIGEMPLDLQPKLLRAIQQQEIYRVGSSKRVKLDVRFIFATNRNLNEQVQEGKFRADLYYRLSVAKIYIPPLKERKSEIFQLAQMFLLQNAETKQKNFRMISADARKLLEDYDWPGNVRELQNSIERVILLYDEIELNSKHLQFLRNDLYSNIDAQNELKPGRIAIPKEPFDLALLEKEIVQKTLDRFNGNKTKTAEFLNLTRSALRSRL
jgi:DNA-binding NtrC family response regulator